MPTGRTVELTVLCEGSTERNFVTQVLHPHLVHHHVSERVNDFETPA